MLCIMKVHDLVCLNEIRNVTVMIRPSLDARVVLCVEDVVRGVLPPCVTGLQAEVFDLADPVR
jgi:hypothetical protein